MTFWTLKLYFPWKSVVYDWVDDAAEFDCPTLRESRNVGPFQVQKLQLNGSKMSTETSKNEALGMERRK